MFSISQIAAFLNRLCLTNELINYPELLHVDTHAENLKCSLKILGWAWSNMGVAILLILIYIVVSVA